MVTLSVLPNAVRDQGVYEVEYFWTITETEAEDKRVASRNGTKNEWLLIGCRDSTPGPSLQFLHRLISSSS